MSEEKDTPTAKQPNKPPFLPPPRTLRRQTRWWVWWAGGILLALVASGLLVAKLYPNIWELLSSERVAVLIGIGVALTVIIVLLALGGRSLGWTGFGERKLWDWLELLSALAIPIVLAAAGYWFTAQQDARQREIEEQRADDVALQAYLDQVSTLMIEHNLRGASDENSEVRTLARARTLTVLARLDSSRKTEVMQFLIEADLVNDNNVDDVEVEDPTRPTNPIIRLEGADLRGADLNVTEWRLAAMNGAALRGADLREADLSHVFLFRADLVEADLREAHLTFADVREAHLTQADLREADLYYADLGGADLGGADLRHADLSGADLGEARLSSAKGWTEEQLRATYSLEGATMPDGQRLKSYFNPDEPTFEEWLKSKNRGEDGENSGSS